jgi:NAD(P) transhydrogenase subunit alpha
MEIDFMLLLYVFVLAMFAGYEVITKVPPILHTPLMSGANAISGVCLIGAILVTGPTENAVTASIILGMIAVIMATINVVGGFMVTDRMLAMFKKE